MLPAFNQIACSQARPTKYTKEQYQKLIDYVATHLQVYIRDYASGVVLYIDSNAVYLILPKKSRIAGYCQLSSHLNYMQ